ncbi:MAG: Gamma-glutamyl phosphate reductase, partial [uncultured Nocardioidaceae bacterium]
VPDARPRDGCCRGRRACARGGPRARCRLTGDQGPRPGCDGRRAGRRHAPDPGSERRGRRGGACPGDRRGDHRPTPAGRGPGGRDGRGAPRGGRAAGPGRRGPARIHPGQRPRAAAAAGAVRCGRDDLRGQAQRDRRRGRHLPEVGQRGAAARLVERLALERGDRHRAPGRRDGRRAAGGRGAAGAGGGTRRGEGAHARPRPGRRAHPAGWRRAHPLGRGGVDGAGHRDRCGQLPRVRRCRSRRRHGPRHRPQLQDPPRLGLQRRRVAARARGHRRDLPPARRRGAAAGRGDRARRPGLHRPRRGGGRHRGRLRPRVPLPRHLRGRRTLPRGGGGPHPPPLLGAHRGHRDRVAGVGQAVHGGGGLGSGDGQRQHEVHRRRRARLRCGDRHLHPEAARAGTDGASRDDLDQVRGHRPWPHPL